MAYLESGQFNVVVSQVAPGIGPSGETPSVIDKETAAELIDLINAFFSEKMPKALIEFAVI